MTLSTLQDELKGWDRQNTGFRQESKWVFWWTKIKRQIMYKRVWIETDPRIMGVRNGVYQVELKENKSFVSKEEKDYYET